MITTIICFAVAGIFNAIMDVLKTRWETSIFSSMKNTKIIDWMNPSISFHNKWKNGDIGQGEKFFGSSTFLVWTTDFWHFCKMIMIISLSLGAVLYTEKFNLFIDGLLILSSFTITFEVFYSCFFIKK